MMSLSLKLNLLISNITCKYNSLSIPCIYIFMFIFIHKLVIENGKTSGLQHTATAYTKINFGYYFWRTSDIEYFTSRENDNSNILLQRKWVKYLIDNLQMKCNLVDILWGSSKKSGMSLIYVWFDKGTPAITSTSESQWLLRVKISIRTVKE